MLSYAPYEEPFGSGVVGCRRIMTRAPLLVLVLSLNVFRVWDSKASRLGEAVRTIIADEDHLHSAMRPPDRSQYPEGTHNQKLEHESCGGPASW